MTVQGKFISNVWVSYSGADTQLIHEFASFTNKLGKNAQTPFRLFTDRESKEKYYQVSKKKTQNKSERTSYIQLGDKVEDLIQTIASNLRRVFFITENYLNSQYCLKEFAYSLIRKPLNPLCIFLFDFNNIEQIRQPRQYKFIGGDNINLEEALTWIYFNKRNDNNPEFEIAGEQTEANTNAYFKQMLGELCNRLAQPIKDKSNKQFSYFSLIMPKEEFTEQAKLDWYEKIAAYVHSINPQTVIEAHQNERKKLLIDWFETDIGQYCKEKGVSPEDVNIALCSQPANSAFLVKFCKLIRKVPLNILKDICKERPEQIEHIASILMTATIKPIWAAELAQNNTHRHPIRMSYQLPEGFKDTGLYDLYRFAGLAAAKGLYLKLRYDDHYEFPLIDNVINFLPTALEEDDMLQNDVMFEIISLVTTGGKKTVMARLNTFEPYQIRAYIDNFQSTHGKGAIVLKANSLDFKANKASIPELYTSFLNDLNRKLTEDEKSIALSLLMLSLEHQENEIINGTSAAYKIVIAVNELLKELL